MPNMDVLKALDELKDAGVEERSARAMIRLVSEAVELQAVTRWHPERRFTAGRLSPAQSTTELRGEIGGTANGLCGDKTAFRLGVQRKLAAVLTLKRR